MKQIVTFVVLLALLQLGWAPAAIAQKGFDVKPLGLLNPQAGSKAKLGAGQSTKAAIKALGQPTRKGKMYFEMEADTATVYYYRANRLYFLKDALVGFELNDNTLAFGKSLDQAFRVGSILTSETKPAAATKTAAAAPATTTRYLVNKLPLTDLKIDKAGRSRNINYHQIAYNHIRYGDEKYDGWFEILFDANNKVINIAMGE